MIQSSLFDPAEERGGDAVIQGQYRYLLTRSWGPDPRTMLWVLLNPSVATATRSDPTLRRCVGYARRERYERIALVNVFAYRCTHPRDLSRVEDPVGPLNHEYVRQAAASADMIIIGWGNHGSYRGQDRETLAWLSDHQLWSLGTTSQGCPRHPLYLSRTESFTPFLVK